MTQTFQTSSGIQNIADRAMLVNINIRMFSFQRTDEEISDEVAKKHNIDKSMGKYQKSLIEGSHMKELKKLAGSIRQEHYRRTLPWAEDGARILTSTGYTDYADWSRKVETQFTALVEKFLGNWDAILAEARLKLNGAFRPGDYPTREELRGKFGLRMIVRPVPVAEDFRVALGETEVSAIRAEMKGELQATVEAAMRSVWEQMRDVVKQMAARLRMYDPNKPGEAPFRDSLVSNIADLLTVLPSLNLTNNPNIDAFCGDMRELIKFEPQELRDSVWKREDTAARAESILSQMSQFVA